jgi:hypothetical protein
MVLNNNFPILYLFYFSVIANPYFLQNSILFIEQIDIAFIIPVVKYVFEVISTPYIWVLK